MEQEKKEMEEKVDKDQKKEGMRMGNGIFISKKSLWFMAGGALVVLAAIGIGKASKKIKPVLVGVAKEGYAFKEWAAGKIDGVKEDVEDIVAEAEHAYYKDIEATEKSIKKEKEILEKIEEIVTKRLQRKE
jgi:hypothetical protein